MAGLASFTLGLINDLFLAPAAGNARNWGNTLNEHTTNPPHHSLSAWIFNIFNHLNVCCCLMRNAGWSITWQLYCWLNYRNLRTIRRNRESWDTIFDTVASQNCLLSGTHDQQLTFEYHITWWSGIAASTDDTRYCSGSCWEYWWWSSAHDTDPSLLSWLLNNNH